MNLMIVYLMLIVHVQTPDGSLLDIIRNAYDLLVHCDIKIAEVYILNLCDSFLAFL